MQVFRFQDFSRGRHRPADADLPCRFPAGRRRARRDVVHPESRDARAPGVESVAAPGATGGAVQTAARRTISISRGYRASCSGRTRARCRRARNSSSGRCFATTSRRSTRPGCGDMPTHRSAPPAAGPAGGETVVTSQVWANGSPFGIDWHVTNHNGRWLVTDVVVDGVSMKATQRSEFAAIIQRNGGQPDALISVLRQQLAQAR